MHQSKTDIGQEGGVVLTTERLTLRLYRQSDLAPFAAMNGDPRVMEFLGGVPMPPDASDRLAADINASHLQHGFGKIAVERTADRTFLGFCGLSREDWYPDDLELGWRLLPEHWGRGYATEAALAWRDFAFDRLGASRIISVADVPNLRSIRVMERIGMRLDNVTTLDDDGARFEAVVYAMTPADRE